MNTPSSLPRVALHPASLRHLKKGHPWITKDEFTQRFPIQSQWLIGLDQKEQPLALLLHDPDHPQVKARVWSMKSDLEQERRLFPQELKMRLLSAVEKRRSLIESGERDNICLVYEEADALPGLQILRLGQILVVLAYASFWKRYRNLIIDALKESLEFEGVLFQERHLQQKSQRYVWWKKNHLPEKFVIQEFGVNYEIDLREHYDLGIYTDMAALRARLKKQFAQKRVLNLYCYTGAYSLFALKNNALEVTSVDLSPLYLSWLERNLSLNPDLEGERHHAVTQAAEPFLKQAPSSQFDLIIVDPPSASTDKKKKLNALQQYERLLPDLNRCLAPGGTLILGLNTHKVNMTKFEKTIQGLIQGMPLKISERLFNRDDYTPTKTLPESRYLKVLVLQKNKD